MCVCVCVYRVNFGLSVDFIIQFNADLVFILPFGKHWYVEGIISYLSNSYVYDTSVQLHCSICGIRQTGKYQHSGRQTHLVKSLCHNNNYHISLTLPPESG